MKSDHLTLDTYLFEMKIATSTPEWRTGVLCRCPVCRRVRASLRATVVMIAVQRYSIMLGWAIKPDLKVVLA